MELETLKTIKISTFDNENGPLKVVVPVVGECFPADKAFQLAADAIGLRDCSRPYFRLFEGLLSPIRCFSPDHSIPEDVSDLSLQKWCFNTKEERTFTSLDEVALQLVFLQAQTWLQCGWIKLCDADIAKLEEYLDPGFTLPNQYLKLCQTSDGYHSYQFNQCTIEHRNSDLSVICRDEPCVVVINLKTIQISSGGKAHVYKWPCLKSWQLRPCNKEVVLEVDDTDMSLTDVIITTPQCHFVSDVVAAMITQIQKATPNSPRFYASMIQTLEDGGTRWKNALYSGKENT